MTASGVLAGPAPRIDEVATRPDPVRHVPSAPSEPVRLAVVVVTYQSEAVLADCLASIEAGVDGVDRWELLVVDNASADTSAAIAAEHPAARVLRREDNRGYAAAINAAVADLRRRDALRPDGAVLICNPDARLHPGCARALLDALAAPGVGLAAPRVLDDAGHTVASHRREPAVRRALAEAVLGGTRAARLGLGELVDERHVPDPRTAWASGAALAVSAACLAEVGPWDESFFLYSEETDFALRARDAGFGLAVVPDAAVTHLGGSSHVDPDLWGLLTANRARSFADRHGRVHALAFRATLLAGELARAPRRGVHRAGARALLAPHRRTWPRTPPGDGWVCFSGQDWWYHNRAHSDFQLMVRIAREHDVLLVNSIGMRLPRPGRSTMPLRRIARKAASTAHLLRRPLADHPRFWVLSPLLLPFYGSPTMRRANASLVRRQVEAACWWLGIERPVCLATIPTAAPVVAALDTSRLLVNRSDKHSTFPEADQATIAALEEQLLRDADVVLYTSDALRAEERDRCGASAVRFDHGVDLELFRRVPEADQPADLRSIPRPRIGYFGGLNGYQIDLDLLEELARSLPTAQLVLIGRSDLDLRRLEALPNVHLLGPRPHDAIPAYGSGFDVAIMPWLDNAWIRYANPIKLKEYLALGLPVVTTPFPEASRYATQIVVSERDHFVDDVAAALERPTTAADLAARRAAVRRDTWDRRAHELVLLAAPPSRPPRPPAPRPGLRTGRLPHVPDTD